MENNRFWYESVALVSAMTLDGSIEEEVDISWK